MSNLVVNGGFESGLANWSVAGLPTPAIDAGVFYPTSPPNSVSMDSLVLVSLLQTVTQTVNGFIPGEQYRLLYAVMTSGVNVLNLFTATVGGVVVSQINLIDLASNQWSLQVSEPFTATAASMVLQFSRPATVGVAFNVNLDNISIIPAAVICFSGNSLVQTKSIETGEIKEIPAKLVSPLKHLLFSDTAKMYVKFSRNAKCSMTDTFILIPKDAINPNEPHTDFLITPGHKVKVNGVTMKAKQVPGAKKVKVEPEPVYTFISHYEDTVIVNGMKVKTWSNYSWNKLVRTRKFTCKYIE